MNRRRFLGGIMGQVAAWRTLRALERFPNIRKDYLQEAETVPEFWVSTVEEVNRFLNERIRGGKVQVIGTTAGGRSMRCVFYGEPRRGRGTTTFSGSLGFGDVRAYRGPDHHKKVYMAMGAVHGGEFEGIIGIVNLLAVLETGEDLAGTRWPEIARVAKTLDRIILLPFANVDGRARVPLRMMRHRGTDDSMHLYLNNGGKLDGSLLGWPDCKEFIPLDFSHVQFPGGYPNDAGVNIQHDDFFGNPQPEAKALFELTAWERPDIVLNMHTGTDFVKVLRPFIEPVLMPVWEKFYSRAHARLTRGELRGTDDITLEADPSRARMSVYNLNTALNLNCGALAFTIEAPSHSYSEAIRNGKQFFHTPELLLKGQLIAHLEAMTFLAETGGRSNWTL